MILLPLEVEEADDRGVRIPRSDSISLLLCVLLGLLLLLLLDRPILSCA